MRAPPRPLSGRELGLVFAACFAAVFVLNVSLIAMPPVWDAVAVFAPAIFLYENGFDLPTLLTSPGYLDGGPNIHSLSVVTFITLGAIALSGGEPSVYLPALHLLNFGLAAVAVAGTFALARHLVGKWTAGLIALALLLFPLFLVQTGMLYVEVAGAAFVVTAMIAFAHRRFVWMAVLVAVACLVKSFGIALVIGLSVLLLCDPAMPIRRRLVWVAALTAPAAVVESARWVATPTNTEPNTLAEHIRRMIEALLLVPDLLIFVALSILAAAAFGTRAVRTGPRVALEGLEQRIEAACLLLPVVMFGLVTAAPVSGAFLLPLPRYYVWVLAPMLIGVVAAAARHAGPRPATIALAVVALFLALNREGAFYPDPGEKAVSFSVAERSLAYLDFYEIQRDGVEGVVELTGGQPVFVTRAEYYYLSSPRMGWVDRDVPNVYFILQPPFEDGRLSDYPAEFFALRSASNYYHGKRVIKELLKDAAGDPGWDGKRVGHWKRGRYQTDLFQVHEVDADR
jgi:hypothetical protein